MSRQQRSPGRPAAGEGTVEARAALIRIAAGLFASQGFEGTSLRQVAEGANVTPAMVAYYFKDKSGLLEAVVREGLGIMWGVIEGVVADHTPGRFVPQLVKSYMEVLSGSPWIPQILIREVISKDSPLRTLFVDEFASRAAAVVPARVAEEVSGGVLREDLDPRFAILSLIGMCLFPFIVHPVLGPVLGYQLDDTFAADYGSHVYRLFVEGAGEVSA